jgi:hypothetical protein
MLLELKLNFAPALITGLVKPNCKPTFNAFVKEVTLLFSVGDSLSVNRRPNSGEMLGETNQFSAKHHA